MDEQRIIELETRITYQEDYIRSLSQTVATLQQQVDDLGRVCDLLAEKLSGMQDSLRGESGVDERPPHY